MMTRKILFSFFLFLFVASVISDAENAPRKRRFTRTSSSPAPSTTAVANDEGQDVINKIDLENEIVKETSVVAGEPSIIVNVATKRSLRVSHCGERIGEDVPFIALLVHTNPHDTGSKKRTLSKGVLISENFVLTTVSSIYHSESFWTVSSVRLGDFVTWNKYANRDRSYSMEIDVDEIFYHKKRDIALIKLNQSVNFTETIRPACLPQSDNYNFKELKTHLCKRSSHSKAPADVTMEFAAPLTTFDCRKFFSRKRISISPQDFCVWDESGDDCAGDIATALFTIHNGRYVLVGLKSYAETEDEDIPDPSEYPGIYIKVGAYLDWMTAVFNSTTKKLENAQAPPKA